jgi:hypothetical protein
VSIQETPQHRHIPLLSRLFAERDPIDEALADLERQGAGSARIAHLFAMLLVVLFSAGSLVALGSDALQAVLVQWNRSHTLDVPSAITLSVSTLMVLAMDTGMLVAAATLRVLAARRAPFSERLVHMTIMAGVAIIEASTYWYMSVRFEAPATGTAQALIIARALAAPILAVYLSMSRALPVTSRDIMSQVELASGRGLLRDVTLAASDRTAPLERKMKLYGASAIMTPAERARLSEMITAVGSTVPGESGEVSVRPYTALQDGSQSLDRLPEPDMRLARIGPPESSQGVSDEDNDRPPTGPGSPSAAPVRTPATTSTQPAVLRLTPEHIRRAAAQGSNPPAVRTPRKAVNHEQLARKAWDSGAKSVERMRRATGMSKAAASSWVRTLKMERDTLGQQQPAQEAAQ